MIESIENLNVLLDIYFADRVSIKSPNIVEFSGREARANVDFISRFRKLSWETIEPIIMNKDDFLYELAIATLIVRL